MSATTTAKKRSRLGYLVFAWVGRQIYSIRIVLECWNDWVDLQAGIYLGEDDE